MAGGIGGDSRRVVDNARHAENVRREKFTAASGASVSAYFNVPLLSIALNISTAQYKIDT